MRVFRMERVDETGCVFDKGHGFPGVVAWIIAFPFDKVEQTFAKVLGI